jgi:hypothetical protein
MLRSIAAGMFVTLVASSFANAQTIYAPVQYQYGDTYNRYYYGGSNPAVFAMAERNRRVDALQDVPYTSDRYTQAYVHRQLIGQLDRVYSDVVPYINARVFGYLPVDASNDAYANVPRYFRMADLRAAAVVHPDGTRVVPAQARPVVSGDAARATTRAAIKPRAIIIIPKSAKPKASDKQLVLAAD